jgi:nitroreductase
MLKYFGMVKFFVVCVLARTMKSRRLFRRVRACTHHEKVPIVVEKKVRASTHPTDYWKIFSMPLRQLLLKNRSYRRFHQDRLLDENLLLELVNLTRLCASAANRQPLKFLLSWQPEQNTRIFPHLRWAAALADWPGPAEGERPAGYVVILGNTQISKRFDWDSAIAAQTILLGAAEQDIGGCMIGSIDRDGLRATLNIPPHLEILLVMALGAPAETVVLEDGVSPDSRPYWRDSQGVHHVPKRPLTELLTLHI